MNANVMTPLLLSLGFKVDEAGQQTLLASLAAITSGAIQASAAVERAATPVMAFTVKIAGGLDALYQASKRTGSSVEGINALEYAVSQMGGDASGVRDALENLARFIRTAPDGEATLANLGVTTRDAHGRMRDTSTLLPEMGLQLNRLPPEQADSYATKMGIDSKTLSVLGVGVVRYQQQYTEMAKTIGLNAEQAAASSDRFMVSLRAFDQMHAIVSDKVGSKLAEGFALPLETLRQRILDNFPEINVVLESSITGVVAIVETLSRLLVRLIQGSAELIHWWQSLNGPTQDLITLFAGLVVGVMALNSAFLASPIGLITALAGAILLLWDDYQTWKEGGSSLIDWAQWVPAIDNALTGIGNLTKSIGGLVSSLMDMLGIDLKNWSLQGELNSLLKQLGEFSKMLNGIADLLNALRDGRWSDVARIGKELWQQGSEPEPVQPEEHAEGGFTRKLNDVKNSIWHWLKGDNASEPLSPVSTPSLVGDAATRVSLATRYLSSVSGTAPLGLLHRFPEPQQVAQLAAGSESTLPYLQVLAASSSAASTSGVVAMSQYNTYNITGQGARDIGSEIERRQLSANAQAMRTAQTRSS